MKRAIYPGSFNPWHEGHEDILSKALKVFDQVIIAVGVNPDKGQIADEAIKSIPSYFEDDPRVAVIKFDGLLVDFVAKMNGNAVIRGLRNGNDFEFEKTQQYWNEDLKLGVPIVYFISDRKLVHISSSGIRAVARAKANKRDT
jgi:pantetheine-phosphate adenylyltransferase